MTGNPLDFNVKLTVRIAGPVRPRTRHRKHKLLQAEGEVNLPFAPYPGLYLTFTQPKKRGGPIYLHLRVRAVEWNVADRRFECIADEVLLSPLSDELTEVRGYPRIDLHFNRLQKTLGVFGFDVATNITAEMALDKCEDGSLLAAH